MSAEAEVSEGTQETTQEVSNEAKEDKGRPAGYEPVDLSDLPPEKAKAVEERINYVYGQLKHNQRMLGEYRGIAQQQSQKLEELTNGVVQVVDHLQNRSMNENEAQLEKQMNDAFESGDQKAYMAAQTKLLDLKVKKELAQQKPKQQYTPPQKQSYPQSASQIANDPDSGLNPQDATVVSSWQDERDEKGQQLRPWAVNKSSNPDRPDPDYIRAALVAQQVFEDNPHRSTAENLAEIDKKMGVKQTSGGQTVMGGSLTTIGKTSKMKLSPDAERIAIRTKFGGPNAKSDAEHIEAYRKQMEKLSSSKRSR